MPVAQEMFAIAPAQGNANLSPAQERLLVGKALWLSRVFEADFPTVPTIVITRAAWEELQGERRTGDTRLRAHWVATLFKLVGRDGLPSRLIVRTSAPTASLSRAVPVPAPIPPPSSESAAVDPSGPLGKAVRRAFDSYGTAADPKSDRSRQLVIVQAFADDTIERFATRSLQTGQMGPAAPAPGIQQPRLPDDADDLALLLDRLAGRHMLATVAIEGDIVRFVSARPIQVGPAAELEAAVDRVSRRIWTSDQAVRAIAPERLQLLLHPRLKSESAIEPIANGLGVSPGAASGYVVFTAEDAARLRARGRHCILVVTETGPTDVEGMKAATGILTARGGMTSHAAVVARIFGRPCVAGVRDLEVDLSRLTCRIGGREFKAGDRLTIDGSDGNVYLGALQLSQPHLGGAIGTLLSWSDMSRRIEVRTNVETVEAARTALSFGAEGIGLARSEHMFFARERMVALRRLILSSDEEARASALKGLVDYQTADYAALFNTMAGRPVTVRLFDPPLHEFLPRSDEDIADTARSLGIDEASLRQRLDRLSEINPMLGHRGVRLAITYPEILEMQMQALMGGVRMALESQTQPLLLEVMVPFVSTATEVEFIKQRAMAIVDRADLGASGRTLFSFGTMIELPRAALRAGEIAKHVDFFSFGTNDLTQTTYGISRDDAPAFLAAYQRKQVYAQDPFVTIDQRGVGELIAIAIERGRAANPRLKIGICGEHAGDPESLRFFAGLGVDYVSCSPYRVPVARLTLAQA